MCDGMRILPPISVPQPTTEPCRERRDPSPPVEPPGVKAELPGWVVKPHSGFSVSHHYRINSSTEVQGAAVGNETRDLP
jgi:hypothetical protein